MDGMVGPDSHTAPDLIERVVGYRAFVLALRSPGWRLVSPFQKDVWDEPMAEAHCRVVRHQAIVHMCGEKEILAVHGPIPAPDCQCGLYAYYDVNRCVRMPYQEYMVYGLVTVEGRLEAHARGMRAERMEIRALAPSTTCKVVSTAMRAANDLGVPFIPLWENLPELAGEFGSPLPEAMRPAIVEKTKVPPALVATHTAAARKRRRRDWRIWRG